MGPSLFWKNFNIHVSSLNTWVSSKKVCNSISLSRRLLMYALVLWTRSPLTNYLSVWLHLYIFYWALLIVSSCLVTAICKVASAKTAPKAWKWRLQNLMLRLSGSNHGLLQQKVYKSTMGIRFVVQVLCPFYTEIVAGLFHFTSLISQNTKSFDFDDII